MNDTVLPSLSLKEKRLFYRDALVLAAATAFAGANASVVIATGGLIGTMLAPSPLWATAPITTFVLGTALMTLPNASLIEKLGRRRAYQIGAFLGVIAGLLGAFALYNASFIFFMVSTFLCGTYQAFVISYRFGAIDRAPTHLHSTFISLVLFGGVVTAFIGPQLVIYTRPLLAPYTFVATYLTQAGFAACAILVLFALRSPPPALAEQQNETPAAKTPFLSFLSSPNVRLAILSGCLAQFLMNILMTSTPLAMVGCHLTQDLAAEAIQWHIVGMYLPSFFTGKLVRSKGAIFSIILGFFLLVLAALAAFIGNEFIFFVANTVLLGMGWNFAFIGASTLLLKDTKNHDKPRLQGMNDFITFSLTSFGSLLSGIVLNHFGWGTLNFILLFLSLLIIALFLFFKLRQSSVSGG